MIDNVGEVHGLCMIENVNDDYCMTENISVVYGHVMIGDVGKVQ